MASEYLTVRVSCALIDVSEMTVSANHGIDGFPSVPMTFAKDSVLSSMVLPSLSMLTLN